MNTIRFVGELSRGMDIRWHSHEEWELVYCTGGAGSFQFENGQAMDYQKGQVVAIPPHVLHANSSTGGFSNIYLNIDSPSFPYKSAFMVSDDVQEHMGLVFSQARFYFLSDLKRRELVIGALGDLITSYIILFRDNCELTGPAAEIRSTIIQNFADPSFELDAAIRKIPFNYDYLRKQFREKIGVTPLQYMTNLRMKKAKSLLCAGGAGNLSVSEIAESCGFRDALYFSRVFKKYYGCSPSYFSGQNTCNMHLQK